MDQEIVKLIAVAIVIVIIIIAAAFRDPNKWYGEMLCHNCSYCWRSRRSTPPARCPSCGAGLISPLKSSDVSIDQKMSHPEPDTVQSIAASASTRNTDNMTQDELYDLAVAIVIDMGRASTSVLQRRLSIGYGRAAQILDRMEQDGFVGKAEGAKPRKVLQAAYDRRHAERLAFEGHGQNDSKQEVRTVDSADLFTPDFMKRFTDFESMDNMLGAGGFGIEAIEHKERNASTDWEDFVKTRTRFTNWQQMKRVAVDEFCERNNIKGQLCSPGLPPS
jgi:hypothetical protein